MSYLTILVLETVLNATPRHCPWSLINLAGSLYKEAPSDKVSKCKSPWQQRQPCKHTTYVLIDQWCLLLDKVLTQLQYIDIVKWGAVGKDNLYPGLFTSRDELMKKCTLKDLKIICKTLEHHTNRCWFETGGVKSAHVNQIIRAFGGTDFVQETALHK